MTTEVLLWVLGVLVGVVIGAVSAAVTFMVRVEARFTRLETKVAVLWDAVSKKMADLLISPHTPELDELLRRFRDAGLCREEKAKMLSLLSEEYEAAKEKRDIGRQVAIGWLISVLSVENE